MATRACRGKVEGRVQGNGVALRPADERRKMLTRKKHLTVTSVTVGANRHVPIDTNYCITTIPEILAILCAPLNRISASFPGALSVILCRRARMLRQRKHEVACQTLLRYRACHLPAYA
jgi:hypothetical protein